MPQYIKEITAEGITLSADYSSLINSQETHAREFRNKK